MSSTTWLASVPFPSTIVEGRMIRRYKRFFVDATLQNGERITAHTANTGKMTGLTDEGSRVLLSFHDNPKRKLKWSLQAVHDGSSWVGVNTSAPNELVARLITAKALRGLNGYQSCRREVAFPEWAPHSGRVDIFLSNSGDKGRHDEKQCWVEVKNATLRVADVALFPDARSERALRHVECLRAARRHGHQAAMVWVTQRTDCRRVMPAAHIDPDYADALTQARREGVKLLAVSAVVDKSGIHARGLLTVVTDARRVGSFLRKHHRS